jgi:hypothetical protein
MGFLKTALEALPAAAKHPFALENASATVQDAIKGIDSLVSAVSAVAKALDLVAELAA